MATAASSSLLGCYGEIATHDGTGSPSDPSTVGPSGTAGNPGTPGGFDPASTTPLTGKPTDPTAQPPALVGPNVIVGNTTIEPGRVVAHRLNRVEYNNTVRDLFYGLDLKPADAFPIDNFAEGFDNNAQELRMSNLLMEKYLDAADKIVAAGFANAASRAKLVPCDLVADATCAQKALTTFLERAYRRPVATADTAPYVKLFDLAKTNGDNAEVGLQVAFRAALVAPAFIFRVEPDPPQGMSRALGDFEIASRLSYFLWSTMPDEELFVKGRAGTLKSPDELNRQVQRMLADPRASALVDNLAGQWLYARQIPELAPDPVKFPAPMFDAPLRDAIRTEMTMFLREIMYGDHSAVELLKANFTFANKRLAQHYGLPEAASLGADFARIDNTTTRGGLLSQAGWLTVTSHPDITSPVRRGKWILSELLCESPPPPPPNVGDLSKGPQTGTLRQRLAIHSQIEPCKTCHVIMDPLGFGLENYDAIGRWRDTDAGEPIDATGALPGTDIKFSNPTELATGLQKDPRFGRCLTRKLLTFAMGRGMEAVDDPALDALTQQFSKGGYRFKDLIQIIATSPLMTMRGGNSAP
jgi:hypothetical protein